ncbi:hypothetical protein HDU76_011270, partial [Blyttiomyces sp. JEL0837]
LSTVFNRSPSLTRSPVRHLCSEEVWESLADPILKPNEPNSHQHNFRHSPDNTANLLIPLIESYHHLIDQRNKMRSHKLTMAQFDDELSLLDAKLADWIMTLPSHFRIDGLAYMGANLDIVPGSTILPNLQQQRQKQQQQQEQQSMPTVHDEAKLEAWLSRVLIDSKGVYPWGILCLKVMYHLIVCVLHVERIHSMLHSLAPEGDTAPLPATTPDYMTPGFRITTTETSRGLVGGVTGVLMVKDAPEDVRLRFERSYRRARFSSEAIARVNLLVWRSKAGGATMLPVLFSNAVFHSSFALALVAADAGPGGARPDPEYNKQCVRWLLGNLKTIRFVYREFATFLEHMVVSVPVHELDEGSMELGTGGSVGVGSSGSSGGGTATTRSFYREKRRGGGGADERGDVRMRQVNKGGGNGSGDDATGVERFRDDGNNSDDEDEDEDEGRWETQHEDDDDGFESEELLPDIPSEHNVRPLAAVQAGPDMSSNILVEMIEGLKFEAQKVVTSIKGSASTANSREETPASSISTASRFGLRQGVGMGSTGFSGRPESVRSSSFNSSFYAKSPSVVATSLGSPGTEFSLGNDFSSSRGGGGQGYGQFPSSGYLHQRQPHQYHPTGQQSASWRDYGMSPTGSGSFTSPPESSPSMGPPRDPYNALGGLWSDEKSMLSRESQQRRHEGQRQQNQHGQQQTQQQEGWQQQRGQPQQPQYGGNPNMTRMQPMVQTDKLPIHPTPPLTDGRWNFNDVNLGLMADFNGPGNQSVFPSLPQADPPTVGFDSFDPSLLTMLFPDQVLSMESVGLLGSLAGGLTGSSLGQDPLGGGASDAAVSPELTAEIYQQALAHAKELSSNFGGLQSSDREMQPQMGFGGTGGNGLPMDSGSFGVYPTQAGVAGDGRGGSSEDGTGRGDPSIWGSSGNEGTMG